MAVQWECGETAAHKHAIKAQEDAGIGFDDNDCWERITPTWDIYTDLREAVIWGLCVVGFPPDSQWKITEDNWKEVFKRLYIYEQITGCSRIYNNGDHKVRKMYIEPEEIYSLIGMAVNAGNKTNAEFYKAMMVRPIDGAEYALRNMEDNKDWKAERKWEGM